MHDQSLPTSTWRRFGYILMALAAVPVVGILIWQGVTSHGNPNPDVPNTSHLSAILDISVLVFREGLESILVLAAITASISRNQGNRAQPIFIGASIGFLATLATWFFVRGIVEDISNNISYLALQALTGLVAVMVLLIVMNWFFHKVYWGGWIIVHNRRKKELLESSGAGKSPEFIFLGLVLLGLTSVYREGFEVVLFLQSYYLKHGGWTVLYGSLFGLGLTLIVAVLTFVAHQRMPYRKMLIFTGVMLGCVLLVMVGEEVYEMQQADWMSTTNIPALAPYMPDWTGVWFSLYPNWETIIAQVLAATFVLGSYFISGKVMASHPAEEHA
ncbi:MAG TPA: FTR1 family protein [Candidatus Methylacidiphilales bacterium]|nr:FTR1 family protein [Candidatus Methylacidiphilales bacterium]